MAYRKSRRRVTKRFYILMAVLIAVCTMAAFLIFGTDRYGKVAMGGMSLEQPVSVVIVRDETVYYVSNYSEASFSVTEGESITQGTTVARVYKWGFDNKLLTDLISIQGKILDAQENDIWADFVSSDLNEINSKINNKIQEIAAVVQGKSDADIVALERKLKELFEQKQDFLKRNVQADARLTDLYNQEAQAQAVLTNWREDITAESGGVVSFYLDGFETLLTPYNLETIRRTDIENARKGVTSGSGSDGTTTTPLYRLINNYKWYCIVYVEANEAIGEMKEGNEAQLTFEGYFDRPYTAKIISVRTPEGGGRMYVLEMNEDVSPLISVRTANATLLLNFEGIKVESDAVFLQDGETMLKTEQNDTIVFVPVEVLIDDGEYCIIKNLSEDIAIDENTVILLR